MTAATPLPARTGTSPAARGSAARAPREPVPRASWLVLAVCAGAAFVAFLDVTIVNIAFPAIRTDFRGTSLAHLSWVFNAYNVVFASLLIPAGRLADLVGRKRLLGLGLVVFGAASAVCGLAPGPGVLIAARTVQAVGAALVTPASLALVLPAFPVARRGTAVSLWGASAAVAAAAGPSLGGVLVQHAGWRWVFGINVPLIALLLVAGSRLLTEARDPDRGALLDPLGVVLLAGGIGALSLAIVQSGTWHVADARTLGALAAGLVLLAGFVLRCARTSAPVVELSLFRVGSFAAGNVAYLVFSIGFYALLLANILFLTGHWGYSEIRAGFAVSPGPVMAALSSVVAGPLIDRHGPARVLGPAAAVFAAGAAVFALRLGAEPRYLADFLPATLLTGLGVGASYASMSTAVVTDLPPARYATGSAVGSSLRQVGAVLGIALLLGRLAADSSRGAFTEAYAGVALCGAVTVTVAGWLAWHLRAAGGRAAPRTAAPATATPEPALAGTGVPGSAA